MSINADGCFKGCYYYSDSCFRADCKKCKSCGSVGFDKSIINNMCTFCDGTEGGNPPKELESLFPEKESQTA